MTADLAQRAAYLRLTGRERLSLKDRLRSNITVDLATGCWLWTGTTSGGYGKLYVGRRSMHAYRAAWVLFHGPIPNGLALDHLCRVRRCCSPDHLEPVTQRVNVLRGEAPAAENARKSECPKGHTYDYREGSGRRRCRTCRAEQSRQKLERIKADPARLERRREVGRESKRRQRARAA